MNNKLLIPVLIVAFALAVPVMTVSANNGWKEFSDSGTNHFAHWTGELIRVSKGEEYWFFTTGEPGQTIGYATMLIIWHPQTQKGTIHCFTHYGHMLYFTDWRGTIEYDSATGEYYFSIRGPGRGSINLAGVWYDGEVWGYYSGKLTIVNPYPLEANSLADWAATIRYHT